MLAGKELESDVFHRCLAWLLGINVRNTEQASKLSEMMIYSRTETRNHLLPSNVIREPGRGGRGLEGSEGSHRDK